MSFHPDASLHAAAGFLALAKLACFGVGSAVATRIGSVLLFADSIDFVEDASVNLLALIRQGQACFLRRKRKRK